MKLWQTTLIGTVTGLAVAAWAMTLSENTTPYWMKPLFAFVSDTSRMLGSLLIGKSEFDGLQYILILLFLTLGGIGTVIGFCAGMIINIIKNRK